MGLTPVKTPKVVPKLFPNYVWRIETERKELYLTFDDGPTADITPWVLDTLKTFNAKATFFCIGKNVKNHPDIFNRILTEGHSIGNHTYSHMKGWRNKTPEYIKNFLLAEKIIKSEIRNQGSKLQKLFRPPYGQIKPQQGTKILEQGYKIIMWDVLSFDWDKTVSQENCLDNVLSKSKQGSIIVFHDSVKASRNMQFALPKVLEHFSNKGFQFKSITL